MGSPGAGKSTLARALGSLLGLPVIHLDRHYWRPGWQPIPGGEWLDLQEDLVAQDAWIIDGSYARTLHLRLERADSVLFLDFGRVWSLLGVLRRWMAYRGRERPDMGDGCPEHLNLSFLTYVWTFPRRERPTLVFHLGEFGQDKTLIRLISPEDVRRFLETVRTR